MGLAVGVFSSTGACVVVLCLLALRRATEFEGEIKVLWFSLKLKTRPGALKDAPPSGEGTDFDGTRSAEPDIAVF
jgi:hypothetical protein